MRHILFVFMVSLALSFSNYVFAMDLKVDDHNAEDKPHSEQLTSFTLQSETLLKESIISLFQRYCMPCKEKSPLYEELTITDAERGIFHLSKLENMIRNSGDYFLVSNNFKDHFYKIFWRIGPHTIQFSVNDYCKELSSIKVSYYLQEQSFRLPFLIRIKLSDSTKFTVCVNKDVNDAVKNLFTTISSLCPTSLIEVASRKKYCEECKPFEAEHWKASWEQAENVSDYYRNYSDSMMRNMIEEHVLAMAQKNSTLLILDIGAGKGRLAKKLISDAQRKGVRLNYVLLEPDKKQCDEADKILKSPDLKYDPNFISYEIINLRLKEFLSTKDCEQYVRRFDAIISSGGPINNQIVSFNTAKENLSIINLLLNSNGKLIATGLTSLMFTKKYFEKSGFTVLNTVQRISTETVQKLFQCYVCKKLPSETELLNYMGLFAKYNEEQDDKFKKGKFDDSSQCKLF